jgi:hypothetical protein
MDKKHGQEAKNTAWTRSMEAQQRYAAKNAARTCSMNIYQKQAVFDGNILYDVSGAQLGLTDGKIGGKNLVTLSLSALKVIC